MSKKILFFILSLFFCPLFGKNPLIYAKNLILATGKMLFPIDEITRLKEIQKEHLWAQQAKPLHILNQCEKIYQKIEDEYDTEVSVYFRQKHALSEESFITQTDRLLKHLESLSEKGYKNYLNNLEINRKKLARHKAYLERAENTAALKLNTKEYEKEAKIFNVPTNQLCDEYQQVIKNAPKLKKNITDQLEVLNNLDKENIIATQTKDGLFGSSLKNSAKMFSKHGQCPKEYQRLKNISLKILKPSISQEITKAAKTPIFSNLSNFLNRLFLNPNKPSQKFKKFDMGDMPLPSLNKDKRKLQKILNEHENKIDALIQEKATSLECDNIELEYLNKYPFFDKQTYDEHIKNESKTFRKQSLEVHPDHAKRKGLSEDQTKKNKELTQIINQKHTAFETIYKSQEMRELVEQSEQILQGKNILEPNLTGNAILRNLQRQPLIERMNENMKNKVKNKKKLTNISRKTLLIEASQLLQE